MHNKAFQRSEREKGFQKVFFITFPRRWHEYLVQSRNLDCTEENLMSVSLWVEKAKMCHALNTTNWVMGSVPVFV